jgi:hypothetical protein
MGKIRHLTPELVSEGEDFIDFLSQRASRSARDERHEAAAAYAAANAGSRLDLDEELEEASLEHLRDEEEESLRPSYSSK